MKSCSTFRGEGYSTVLSLNCLDEIGRVESLLDIVDNQTLTTAYSAWLPASCPSRELRDTTYSTIGSLKAKSGRRERGGKPRYEDPPPLMSVTKDKPPL